MIALGWVSLLTDAASDMIYPLVPAFLLRELRVEPEPEETPDAPAETAVVEPAEKPRSRRRTARAVTEAAPDAA